MLRGVGLRGSLPASVWSLARLERLDLRDNMLRGPIPPWPCGQHPGDCERLGLPSEAALQVLQLGGNSFGGTVPPLAAFTGLERL